MSNLKYKVGDRVKIKSLDWYSENRDEKGNILDIITDTKFSYDMIKHCETVMTIIGIDKSRLIYTMVEDEQKYIWTEKMIEGLAKEEIKFGTASNPLEIKSNANCLTQEKVDETKPEPKFKVGDKITNGKDKLLILNIVSDKYIVEDNLGECGTLYFNTQDYWKLMEEENKEEDIAWMYDSKLVAERFNDGIVIKQPKYNKLSINTEFCKEFL